jgi:hypothetical protein
LEQVHQVLSNPDGNSTWLSHASREVCHQCRNVFDSGTKGRHLDRQHIQAVEKVLPEVPRCDFTLDVAVRGSDDSYIDRDRPARSDGVDRALLQDPQQLDLHVKREVADLVEEQATAMGQLKPAHSVCQGAGESAFAMTKQLALDQLLRDCCAVDRHEMSISPI